MQSTYTPSKFVEKLLIFLHRTHITNNEILHHSQKFVSSSQAHAFELLILFPEKLPNNQPQNWFEMFISAASNVINISLLKSNELNAINSALAYTDWANYEQLIASISPEEYAKRLLYFFTSQKENSLYLNELAQQFTSLPQAHSLNHAVITLMNKGQLGKVKDKSAFSNDVLTHDYDLNLNTWSQYRGYILLNQNNQHLTRHFTLDTQAEALEHLNRLHLTEYNGKLAMLALKVTTEECLNDIKMENSLLGIEAALAVCLESWV